MTNRDLFGNCDDGGMLPMAHIRARRHHFSPSEDRRISMLKERGCKWDFIARDLGLSQSQVQGRWTRHIKGLTGADEAEIIARAKMSEAMKRVADELGYAEQFAIKITMWRKPPKGKKP